MSFKLKEKPMNTKKHTTFAQQQQLKCLLRSLNPQQLKGALYKLRNIVGSQLEASSKMISYKWFALDSN